MDLRTDCLLQNRRRVLCYFFSVPSSSPSGCALHEKDECLPSRRLSGRASSKLAVNLLGTSIPLRRIAKSLHRVDFVATRRDVGDREKFSAASMGRRKCALWTSRTCARSTCGSESAQWMAALQSLRFLISAN